ncbi:MAG: radical SAM protein [Phycisphaerales bacterium]
MGVTLSVLGNPERAIKATRSRCPVCLAEVPADIVESRGRVLMRKRCVAHGPFEVQLAKDPRFYYDSRGAANACCGGSACCAPTPQTGAAPTMEAISTCIALIEIVDTCNLKCPTCFAGSPWGVGKDVQCTPFEKFVERVQGVIDRKGEIEILQLSGGEPTIHPEFFRLLDWALAHARIGYVLINTNAVRIAGDARFRADLAQRRRERGKFELYVQFDGVQEAGQVDLRGEDLRALRERAIDSAGAEGVPSTLAMVLSPATLPHAGEALRFGLSRRHCRGIVFQPMFTSGRVSSGSIPLQGNAGPHVISVGDTIHALTQQCPDLLKPEDFTPLPCGDPNCHTISYLLRLREGTAALGSLVDLASLQGFLQDRVNYRMEDLAQCGCDNQPLADLLKAMELGPDAPFRVFIKPFMDAWTFDQDRIDRCCTHVIRKDGSLDSFCRYYLAGGGTAC